MENKWSNMLHFATPDVMFAFTAINDNVNTQS